MRMDLGSAATINQTNPIVDKASCCKMNHPIERKERSRQLADVRLSKRDYSSTKGYLFTELSVRARLIVYTKMDSKIKMPLVEQAKGQSVRTVNSWVKGATCLFFTTVSSPLPRFVLHHSFCRRDISVVCIFLLFLLY